MDLSIDELLFHFKTVAAENYLLRLRLSALESQLQAQSAADGSAESDES